MSNISYYVIPGQLALNMAAHWIRIFLVSRAGKGWNNADPRNNVAKVQSLLTKAQFALLERASNAHSNGQEFMPLLVAAIVSPPPHRFTCVSL